MNMATYENLRAKLIVDQSTWLVTGVAGFIGSNLLEALLKLNQRVVGLDNFSTGYQSNLDEVKALVTQSQWANFSFIEGDIRDIATCHSACEGVTYVLHQAALGSVPRSIEDPITTNQSNIDGFLNVLVAARDSKVKRFVYAASSSTYGDHPDLPKIENRIGKPLSPYAVTKLVNELYAEVFSKVYNFKSIGLRYFNIFGPRQNPEGAYAAVIPRWITSMMRNKEVYVNGDGHTSRDFCYIENAIQANLLAATVSDIDALDTVYNIAVGERTSLRELYGIIKNRLRAQSRCPSHIQPIYRDFRAGDVLHSQADINKAVRLLGYCARYNVEQGLNETVDWFLRSSRG